MKIKFDVTIKKSPAHPGQMRLVTLTGQEEVLGREVLIEGLPIDVAHVTVEQLQEVPELEAKLEKLTGLRFHINQVG